VNAPNLFLIGLPRNKNLSWRPEVTLHKGL
jgi:hypothetical protein